MRGGEDESRPSRGAGRAKGRFPHAEMLGRKGFIVLWPWFCEELCHGGLHRDKHFQRIV